MQGYFLGVLGFIVFFLMGSRGQDWCFVGYVGLGFFLWEDVGGE